VSLSGLSLKADSHKEAIKATEVLFEEGKWGLHKPHPTSWADTEGWQSVISHDCKVSSAPCRMLIEHHSNKTACPYCAERMPPSIVALFKLQNGDIMK